LVSTDDADRWRVSTRCSMHIVDSRYLGKKESGALGARSSGRGQKRDPHE
jgi:hypothetical protein